MRDAIYGELLRGRRVRYHHKIAVATERVHGESVDTVRQRAGPPLLHGCGAGGRRQGDPLLHQRPANGLCASSLSRRPSAISPGRSKWRSSSATHDQPARCDALIALAEAQNRAGDAAQANANFARAAALARSIGDPERLANTALRAGPLSYLGVVGAHEEQIELLEEALGRVARAKTRTCAAGSPAQLGLVTISSAGVPGPGVLERALELSSEAVAMARRLGDRLALGYALRDRMHVLWGIDPAPERLAAATELGEIADDVGDEFLALHGHMWRIRELLAQGDVDAVNEELTRFQARDTGPVHPLEASWLLNVGAMMALLAGDIEQRGVDGSTGLGGGGGLQRARRQLLRGAHGVDVVATRRARGVSSRCSRT